jgi:oxygen-dependent protoporphyrinogen oxidase
VPAGTTSSAIFTRGAMRPLPRRQFMGVPADIEELGGTGVVSADGVSRARREEHPPPPAEDVSVAGYIGSRLGGEVVDRLVDPLLGGVYAGRSDELSFRATLAPLAAATRKYPSLIEAAASLIPPHPAAPGPQPPRPVFVTLAGGLGSLPETLAKASGADVRTGAMVRELTRTTAGWRLVVGSAASPEQLQADAVILAVPAAPAARLLAGTAAAASQGLTEIPYASMAIITLAFRAEALFQQQGPDQRRSGYLVPAVDGKAVKAVTFSTVKWPHLTGYAPVHIVRCSIGRIGDVTILQRDDEDLAALATAELGEAIGVTAAPVATRVTRWGGALPQYTVGHTGRIARIRADVARHPGLAVAGAAYEGVGIPACVATARSAVGQILTYLKGLYDEDHGKR